MDSVNTNLEQNNIFDIYTHLKCNIKCTSSICEIHDSNFTHYCIACKRGICEVCKESFHSTHEVVVKDNEVITKNKILSMFKNLEQTITNSEFFSKPSSIANSMINKTNKEFDELHKKLDEIKELRLNKIRNYFSHSKSLYAENLNSSLSEIKKSLLLYIDDFNNFFFEKGINDDDCFIFLLNYDIVQELDKNFKYYSDIIKEIVTLQMSSDLMNESFLENLKSELTNTLNILKEHDNERLSNKKVNDGFNSKIVLRKNSSVIRKESSNLLNKSNNSQSTSNTNKSQSVSKNNTQETQNRFSNLISKNSNNNSNNESNSNINERNLKKKSSKKIVKIIENETVNKQYKSSREINEGLDKLYKNLELNKFEEINFKIKILKEHVISFKEKVYLSFEKNGTLVEIEKIVRQLEENATKRMIHMQRSSMRFSQSKASTKSQGGLTRSKAVLGIKKNESENDNDKLNKSKEEEKKKGSEKKSISDNKKTKEKKENAKSDNKKVNKMELFSLNEVDDEDDEKLLSKSNSSSVSDEDSNLSLSIDNEIEVEIEKNKVRNEKKNIKLEKMFMPRKKEPKLLRINSITQKVKQTNNNDSGFVVNVNLLELIKENKRLMSMIKNQNDINLKITTVRRYFSFETLEYIRKSLESKDNNNANQILLDYEKGTDNLGETCIKVHEGKSEFSIYDKKSNKMTKYNLAFDKKKHKIQFFPFGCRSLYYQDKLYVTGGKCVLKGDLNIFFVYCPKENKITRLSDMKFPRSYHTIIYHDNLKSLVAIGGENNATGEMYDFYLNIWNPLPPLNIPRANPIVYIDKLGAFAYVFSGILGLITSDLYCDGLECLDLIDMAQGWERIDYFNKANVDIKRNEIQMYPLSEDKLLIYGANLVRYNKKKHAILDLKNFELQEVDEKHIDLIKLKLKNFTEKKEHFNKDKDKEDKKGGINQTLSSAFI